MSRIELTINVVDDSDQRTGDQRTTVACCSPTTDEGTAERAQESTRQCACACC